MQIRIEKRKDGEIDLIITRTIRSEGRPRTVRRIPAVALRHVLDEEVRAMAKGDADESPAALQAGT